MIRGVARSFVLRPLTQVRYNSSIPLRSEIEKLNQDIVSPLKVSEAKALGANGETVVQDELRLYDIVRDLYRAENFGVVPQSQHYNDIIKKYASRGSISVVHAILSRALATAPKEITGATFNAYATGLLNFGDVNRAKKVVDYAVSKNYAIPEETLNKFTDRKSVV